MNKKTLYILLFFVSILSFLVACEDSNKKIALKLNMTELSMNIGEVVKLEVSNASGDVTFVSGNDSVATVDNEGQITALTAGQATITVSDDDDSLVCNVTVLSPEFDGTHIISVETEVVDLIIGDEYQLEPRLLRGLDVVKNVNFKYTSMDESIVTVNNGKITALKIGETFVQIDAVDYVKVSKIVKVVVSEDFTIDLSDGNIVLSRMEILDYKTSEEISYVVKDNGNILDVDDLSVSISDENIVSVEKVNDKYLIKALNFGEAKVSFSYKRADGSETVSFVSVEVVKPLIDLDKEYYFSKVNGIVDFNEFDFSKYNLDINANNCINVYDNIGNEFPILSTTLNSVIINSKNNIAENGENKKMYYDMSEFIVSFDIVQCTLAIRTVEDFLSMSDLLEYKLCDDNIEHKRIDGYIFLVNDLDFTGVEYVPFCGFLELDKDFSGRSGWSAIFEGNHKMLKNITLGSSGHKEWNSIFGNVGWDAEIRNLAIVDCKFAENAAGAVISDYFHGTISNVFISVTLDTTYTEVVPDYIEKKTNGFTIATPYKYSTIEELTVVVTNTLPDNIYNNVISGGPIYSGHSGTYNLIESPIKSLISIGGGDESKLMFGYDSIEKIKEENGANGYIMNYETIEEAANSVIADNGSTSFSVEEGRLQIKFNGVIVYSD